MFEKGESELALVAPARLHSVHRLVAAYRLRLRRRAYGWAAGSGGFLGRRRGAAMHRGRVTFLHRRAGGEWKDSEAAEK